MRKIIFTFCSMLLVSFLYGQHIVGTLDLRKQYTPKDVVCFEITPQVTDTLYLSIGLEKLIDNKWVEVLNDISKLTFGSKRIEIIRLLKAEMVKCNLNNLPQPGKKKPMKGTYRFTYNIGYSFSQLEDNPINECSSEFTVK